MQGEELESKHKGLINQPKIIFQGEKQMNEKLAEKLTKILAEKGLENDAIDDVIDEIEDVIAEGDVKEEEIEKKYGYCN